MWQTRADRRRALEQRAKEERTAEATGSVVRELLPSLGAAGERGEVIDRLRGLQMAADLGVLPDDAELQSAIMNVAGVFAQEMKSEWAAEWSLRQGMVLERRADSAAKDDLRLAQIKHDAARALLGNRARVPEARALAEESLSIRRRRLGDQDKEVAEGLELLGRVALAEGRASMAREHAERAIAILGRLDGDRSAPLARCNDLFARVALAEGHHADAMRLGEGAIAGRFTSLSDGRPEIQESLRLFEEIARSMGRERDEAPGALGDGWRAWGAERWRKLASGLDRTASDFTPARYADALGELAWLKGEVLRSEGHPAVVATRVSEAWWLLRTRRSDRAAEVLDAQVPHIQTLTSANSIAVANCYEQVALCRNFVGMRSEDARQAEEQHMLAAAAYSKCLGIVNARPEYAKDAALVGKLRIDLATSLSLAAARNVAHFAAADEACKEAIEFVRANLGEAFYRLPAALQTHAELLMRRGETREAALARIDEAIGRQNRIDPTAAARLGRMREIRAAILEGLGRTD